MFAGVLSHADQQNTWSGSCLRLPTVLQNEYATMRKKPFQDVAELVNAESRWRKRYQSYFDEEMAASTSLSPWLALTDSHDDICPAHAPKMIGWKSDARNSNTASNVLNAEGDGNENATVGEKKSESDTTVQRRHSLNNAEHATEGEDEDHDITKVSKSKSDVDHTDPGTLPSAPGAEGKHDTVAAPASQTDLRPSDQNQLPPEDTSIST